jgi:hypothetical protein
VIFAVEISPVQLQWVFVLKLDAHVPIVLAVELMEQVVVIDEVAEVNYLPPDLVHTMLDHYNL